jgi:hypothetical protein
MDIKIDQEFRDIIPALTGAEFEQLEKNIIEEGCREKIITWNGFLIDGHNRYKICEKNSIKFEVLEKNDFEDRHAVINWMIQNQIGKRNLTGGTISYLRGLKLKREKQRKLELENLLDDKGDVILEKKLDKTEADSTEVSEKEPTPAEAEKDHLEIIKEHEEMIAQEVSEMYRVATSTLKKDEKFADAIDTIRKNTGREIQDKILNKELKLNPIEVVSISKMDDQEQKELLSGDDEEILERLAEVRQEKMDVNHKKAMIKLDQKLLKIADLNRSNSFLLDSDGEVVSLIHQKEDEESLIGKFKGATRADSFLDGFIAGAELFATFTSSSEAE